MIAAVNGHAFAGGLITALCCDYRVGPDADARFALNEVPIGLRMQVYTSKSYEMWLAIVRQACGRSSVGSMMPNKRWPTDTLMNWFRASGRWRGHRGGPRTERRCAGDVYCVQSGLEGACNAADRNLVLGPRWCSIGGGPTISRRQYRRPGANPRTVRPISREAGIAAMARARSAR